MKLKYFDAYGLRAETWANVYGEEVTYTRKKIGTAIIGEMLDIKPIYKAIWRQRGWRKSNFFWSAYVEPQRFSTYSEDSKTIYAIVINDTNGEFYILNSNSIVRALLEGNLQ